MPRAYQSPCRAWTGGPSAPTRRDFAIAPPLWLSGVMLADFLPIGRIRTVRHRQRRQIPNIRRQSQISIADDNSINIHGNIVCRHVNGQGGLCGNRQLNDGIEKRIGECPRRMNIHLPCRLVVDRDADRAHGHRGIADRQFAGCRQAGEFDGLDRACSNQLDNLRMPQRQPS